MKKALGRGLSALFPDAENEEPLNHRIVEMEINLLEPNLEQPRKNFDDVKISKLADSILKQGVIQPLIVKKYGDSYRIIAGERRWRAARVAGIKKVPVIIREATDAHSVELALIENIMREDLNPIEEAQAYEKLINEHKMTQENLAELVGKSRPAITNLLRLLKLSDKIRKYVISGAISEGHARAILTVSSDITRDTITEEIIRKGLSVRDTEKLAALMLKRKNEKAHRSARDENEEQLEEELNRIFGTKVMIQAGRNAKKGRIVIEYYSAEELERLLEMFDRIKDNNVSRETKKAAGRLVRGS